MLGTDEILEKSVNKWKDTFPIIGQIIDYRPVFWLNEGLEPVAGALQRLPIAYEEMLDAERRLQRFAPLLVKLFPETWSKAGMIESELTAVDNMKVLLQQYYNQDFQGRLLLKCDNALPVAGSIKARGGIYEVLKHAEDLVLSKGWLKETDDYAKLAEPSFRDFFAQYSLAVGSTGNLGLSIGIMGAALGFKVTVHMSADAKAWKKSLLRSRGVNVVEYASDYSKAVEEGRKQSMLDPASYFVDDEHSKNLFLGYSVAALRLRKQLAEQSITVNEEHPLFAYLPCGVGGAPGGICFGLKQVFGDNVHVFFVEPTHSPCMLLGVMTGAHDSVSVQDFGMDNITEADGLAVGRASGFVGKVVEHLLSGIYTVDDRELNKLLAMMQDSEGIKIEPSATPGLLGPILLQQSPEAAVYLEKHRLMDRMQNAVHLAWATGGLFVPDAMMQEFYQKGKQNM